MKNHKILKIALIGRTNSGKSTFINFFSGKDSSIVTRKANTTHDLIQENLEENDHQVIFFDTPGLAEKNNRLSAEIRKKYVLAINECDEIYYFIDASRKISKRDLEMLTQLNSAKTVRNVAYKITVLFTKVDLIKKELLLEFINTMFKIYPNFVYFPISVLKKNNMSELRKYMFASTFYVQKNDAQNDYFLKSKKLFMISELVRKELILHLYNELPKEVKVEAKKLSNKGNKELYTINIFITKKAQKPIILGKKGEKLKRILTLARKNIEKALKKNVFLKTKIVILTNKKLNTNN